MARRLQPLVAGNWKMNGLGADLAVIRAIRDRVVAGDAGEAEVLVCPPATLVRAAAEIAGGSPLAIGGQTCHWYEYGAHTGDISPVMLTDAGATYVILGHSERRADHGETNVAVKRKAIAAMGAGLKVIICVGETKSDRDSGRELTVVGRQLLGSLPTDTDPRKLTVAYEPIWAIGTGVTPKAHDIAEMHQFIRREVGRLFPGGGDTIRILYGGSVKPDNAVELLGVPNVDGALVGGASLNAAAFMGISAAYKLPVSAVG